MYCSYNCRDKILASVYYSHNVVEALGFSSVKLPHFRFMSVSSRTECPGDTEHLRAGVQQTVRPLVHGGSLARGGEDRPFCRTW